MPSAPGHEVQPVCFDTSELPFVLIVYQIRFRPWHRSVIRFELRYSPSSLYRLLVPRVHAWSADMFVRKVSAHYIRGVYHGPAISPFANPYVRNFVDAAPRAVQCVIYMYTYIRTCNTYMCCICTLDGDLSPRWLPVRQDISLFLPTAAARIPARIVSVLYFIGILKFKEPQRFLPEIRPAWTHTLKF